MTVKGAIALTIASILMFFIMMVLSAPYTLIFKSEQYAQVEVVGKRVRPTSVRHGKDSYIVAFKFPDGSVKELEVGIGRRKVYDSIQEGDTGMLTYKERENIEEKIKNEELQFDGRRFISFKRDT